MRWEFNTSFAALASLLFAACSAGTDPAPVEENPFGVTGIPPQIRAGVEGSAVAGGGNAPLSNISITPQEAIIFTDPDKPSEGIPELEELMAAPKSGPWEASVTIARQTAAREGKPVLIWFTDSARSPMCKALSAELFSKRDFGKWAGKHLVRLRIDSNTAVDDLNISLDEKINRQSELKQYVKHLKEHYKVLGHPTLLMLNPSGEVIWKETGYKRGEADFTWGLIKQAEVASSHHYEKWRESLEKKGYREWEGKRGRKVFAKLLSYSDGNLIMIEPGGQRYKTKESKLSKEDRRWIEEQKALRGIE
jgi:thioredoxin-related protein